MAQLKNMQRLIRQAKGGEPADLVLKGCRVMNVFTREVVEADVAICEGWIAGVGAYTGRREMDCSRYYASPGFIEGHIHIESSMLSPDRFVHAVLPLGTTTIICDPHEIANVAGVAGIQYFLRETKALPATVYIMAPSCVPATHLETSGAELDAAGIAGVLQHPRVIGLAEMMNYPGVLFCDPGILEKIRLASACNLPLDGHSPGLSGEALQAYVAMGIGSDHECTTAAEALEKLRAGMHLFIREGGVARNLKELLPVVNERNVHRCLLVTDDCHPDVLEREGHLDRILRKAIGLGLDPLMALQMVTINAARYFRLGDRGAVAAGFRADVVLFEDLNDIRVRHVFTEGRLRVEDGKTLDATRPSRTGRYQKIFHSIRLQEDVIDLAVPAKEGKLRVIRLIKDQIVTDGVAIDATVVNGYAVADPKRDLAKIAVLERHHGTGRKGVGFVTGMGLTRGALAGTIAHDSHNIIAVGMSDDDMRLAVKSVVDAGGGLAVAADNHVLSVLQLDVAGLMSTRPLREVNAGLEALLAAAETLGAGGDNPFLIMSFLALPVIPHLKITDMGLVDVDAFQQVGLWV